MDLTETYNQQRAEAAPVDWNKILETPYEQAIQQLIVWKEYEGKAGSWVTCACGNQCNIIPRDNGGEPEDGKLTELGFDFYGCIKQTRRALEYKDQISYEAAIKKAKGILLNIEKRSTELIAEILIRNRDE